MTSPAVVAESHGRVALVRLDRPRALGALNSEMLGELDGVGADLDELAGLDAVAAHDVLSRGQAVFRRIELCPIPVVAAVNGLALGGGFELILATTFPVLAEHATLGLPEAGLGLMPGYGGTQRLTRAIGRQAAI